MKTSSVLAFCLMLSIATFAQSKNHPKKFTMDPGKFRQMLYLPQAQPAYGVYMLDTFMSGTGLHISIIAGRNADQFKIKATKDSADTIVTVMQQYFFMDGTRDEEREVNPWLTSWKKKELKQFIYDYFGIVIQPRRKFIRENQNLLKNALRTEASFIGRKLI